MNIKIIKSKKPLLLIGIIILIIIPSYIIFNKDLLDKNKFTIQPKINLNFKDVIPGKTKVEDLEKILGKPIDVQKNNTIDELSYSSNNPNRDNIVQTDDSIVTFIKEIISSKNEKSKTDILSNYGNPPHRLYGPNSNAGTNLYVYPDKGIAFLGSDDHNQLEEIWHFSPTTYENFKKTYATNYSETIKQYQ